MINEQLLKTTFSAALKIKEGQYSPQLQMGDLEGWDSIGHLNLIFAIESAFRVKFELTQIPELTSVEKIIEALKRCAS